MRWLVLKYTAASIGVIRLILVGVDCIDYFVYLYYDYFFFGFLFFLGVVFGIGWLVGAPTGDVLFVLIHGGVIRVYATRLLSRTD
ncbi:hypothetical protein, partial [Pseudomonas aeruginosa]|uniref:hypothetical protein n=1 Tax=Pseudomonas aeruginosa TaxID=287 RepID=UPI003CC6A435